MISLDPIHHKVIVDSREVELQPLTFALFARLLEHKNQIVSLVVLTDEVWGDVAVSPDTLKQRIFLLRKALEEADVQACSVQSVRGQGYRLVVPDEGRAKGAAIHHKRWVWVIGLVAILAVVTIYSWQVWQPYDPPPNSRVVFWRASQTDLTHDAADKWEQMWMTQLSLSDEIIFVAAKRDPAQSITDQARQAKAALISVWTHFESDGQQLVRMQILEPKTASTLRSDLAAMDDSDGVSRLLAAQMQAIERVLESGTLPLLTEALNNTDHPAWAKLRKLANDPS